MCLYILSHWSYLLRSSYPKMLIQIDVLMLYCWWNKEFTQNKILTFDCLSKNVHFTIWPCTDSCKQKKWYRCLQVGLHGQRLPSPGNQKQLWCFSVHEICQGDRNGRRDTDLYKRQGKSLSHCTSHDLLMILVLWLLISLIVFY